MHEIQGVNETGPDHPDSGRGMTVQVRSGRPDWICPLRRVAPMLLVDGENGGPESHRLVSACNLDEVGELPGNTCLAALVRSTVAGGHPGEELLVRHGPGDVIALHHGATQLGETLKGLSILHAFGHHG
jgi:hypothetical protein